MDERLVGGLWCHQVLELLHRVVEGSLPEHERRAVREHLSRCSVCESFGQRYAEIVRRLRDELGVSELEPDIDRRLTERLVKK